MNLRFNIKFSVIMGVVVLSMVACQFADEKKMKEKYGAKPAIAEAEIANENYIKSINFIPGEEPNQYSMQVEFNELKKDPLNFEFICGENFSGKKTIAVNQMDLEVPAIAGSICLINLYKITESGDVNIWTGNKTTPKDLEFEGHVILKVDLIGDYQRVFFRNGSTLETRGNQVILNINELIAGDNSAIKLFEPRVDGEISRENLKSGQITLRIKTGQGSIFIDGSGLNGTKGKDGKPHLPIKADNGRPGRDAKSGSCGSIGFGSTVTCGCQHNSGSGTHGRDGLNGNAGENGLNGTDAAVINVIIAHQSDLKVSVVAFGGRGGLKGFGSLGQLGGQGGRAGRGAPGCNDGGSNGQDGKNGQPGKDGLDGRDGQSFSPCVRMEDKIIHGCEMIPKTF